MAHKVVRWMGGYSIETDDKTVLKDFVKLFEAMDSGLGIDIIEDLTQQEQEDELVCPECNGTLFEELTEEETEETITLQCDKPECGYRFEIPKDNMEEGE